MPRFVCRPQVCSGKKAKNKRRVLEEALHMQRAAVKAGCKRAVYMVAKMDRLCREIETFTAVMKSDVPTIFADLKDLDFSTPNGKLILTVVAAIAQHELAMIHERTSKGIAAARRRREAEGSGPASSLQPGMQEYNQKVLAAKAGYVEDLAPLLEDFIHEGMTLKAMAKRLAQAGHKTFRLQHANGRVIGGHANFSSSYVRKLVHSADLQTTYEDMLSDKADEWINFQKDQQAAKQAAAVAKQAVAAKQATAKPQSSKLPPVVAYRIQAAKMARVKREREEHETEIKKRPKLDSADKTTALKASLESGVEVVTVD